MDITTIFCEIDDFCKNKQIDDNRVLLPAKTRHTRQPKISQSEIMTIIVIFHLSHYRTFKWFYIDKVCNLYRNEFTHAPSYNRFIELIGRSSINIGLFLLSKFGTCDGISFIDSTTIDVCLNQRINQHKVFKEIAKKGKTSTGWFFGFKLHITINDQGELLGVTITPGNTDDRDQKVINSVTKGMFGKLIGDKGYISKKLSDELLSRGIELVTKAKKNMKNKFIPMYDKILLRKRAIIECVNDMLKNQCQIEHSRHRSIINCFTHLLGGLIAYIYLPKKPSLNIDLNKSILAI